MFFLRYTRDIIYKYNFIYDCLKLEGHFLLPILIHPHFHCPIHVPLWIWPVFQFHTNFYSRALQFSAQNILPMWTTIHINFKFQLYNSFPCKWLIHTPPYICIHIWWPIWTNSHHHGNWKNKVIGILIFISSFEFWFVWAILNLK